jgi:hypothetical protein
MSHRNKSRFSNAIIQIGIKFIYVGIGLQCKNIRNTVLPNTNNHVINHKSKGDRL